MARGRTTEDLRPCPARAQRAAIVQRRADAVELRLAGADPLTVGRKLAAAQADIEELRALEGARLDRLYLVAYRRAVRDGELQAIDRALRIMERRARLLGLDQPVRTEITGHDGGPIKVAADATSDELAALIALTDPAAARDEE
ncbi:hypothetical protein ACIPLC_27730 [Kitasatospora sp. NPDC086801]|uniref:hypothetical protein n=1 Tax=Kitasatospora sp. NPDC086801 TaxID=3364066 RepID=UPI003829A585